MDRMVTRSDTSRLFSVGSMKSMVYSTEEDLIARIHGAIESLADNCTYWVMCVKFSTADVGGSAMM